MLSFSGKIHMRNTMKQLITIIKNITKSLQVPCSPLFYTSRSYLPGKRVLPFISQKQVKKRFNGSIAVEAALVLPLFLFFGMAVLAPIRWLDTQRQIQTVAEHFGEDLSWYTGKEDELLSDTAAGLWLYGKVQSFTDSVWIDQSDVFDEQGNVHLELAYQEQIPFFFEKIRGVTMRVSVNRRVWNGLDGKLKVQHTDGNPDGEMVYVTPEGARYHRYRDCSYLVSACKAVSMEELEQFRNNDRKIYYMCSHCVFEPNTQDTVYISDWGIRYHYDQSCAARSSYYRKVPLSDVIDWGECSVCAGRNVEP